MRTTVIMNLKGGVGKTTTAIYLGRNLSLLHGRRVLLIDADPQCNLSEFFNADLASGNLAGILRNGGGYHAAIQPTAIPGLDIIAAGDELMELDLSSLRGEKCNVFAIRSIVEDLAALDLYDNILVDCPTAFNAAAVSALVAADDVLIPIKLDAFSLRGMGNITRQIRNMQRVNPKLHVAGFLPTMWYRSEHIQQAEETLRKSGLRIYRHIRRSAKVDEMSFTGKASKHSGSEIDYRRFTSEYLKEAKRNGI